ncbi:MAG: cystathionine gamma-synthase [Planctomycetales bacterium]|nr:cystathionine gamma-synthase [Planctomycetales bacterium]
MSPRSARTKGTRFGTTAVHCGPGPDPATGALWPPIVLSATFAQEAPGKHKGFEYSRTRNPTRVALEKALADLEGGAHGLAFASGCAAASAVVHLLSTGDHIVAGNDLYGGTYRLFTNVYARFGIETSYVDTTDLAAVKKAMRPKTRLVWVETPSNPLLRITDLRAIAALSHERGALVAVDNTFATPALQRPLEHGADLVVHSTTKYLGGHSDVVGGAIVLDDPKLRDDLAYLQNAVGGVPGVLDSYLVFRGLKTLAIRMETHGRNAERIAGFLGGHRAVERVMWPGLRDHPGHGLAARQMTGFGGMISVVLRGGLEAGLRLVSGTKLFRCAESLGGVESLIEHPASMTHASIPKAEREKAGLSDGLVRLSVGIEDPEDLVEDLRQALRPDRA